MSIETRRRADGRKAYRVRWRSRGRNRAKTFNQLRDAQTFEIELRRRHQLGELFQEVCRQTVDDLLAEWWVRHVEVHLAPKTREVYRGIIDRRISPALGHLRLVEVTPQVVEDFAIGLRKEGVGPAVIRKSLVVLQGAMRKAVLWGRVPSNPVAVVPKPPQQRKPVTSALGPRQVEAIRRRLSLGDATLVSLLAYAGLRPGEALALRWSDVRDRTLLVARAASLGQVRQTKTGRARSVMLLPPLAGDLAEWRAASGRPDGDLLVFPSSRDCVWSESDWRNWRRRVFAPAVTSAGLSQMTRPYDLRHAFCSLLIAEGRSIVDVAAQMGHAPTMTLDTYAHLIAEVDGAERVDAVELITSARSPGG